jgi:leucyl/phenylalanyl-tRNA--protein transferase
MAPGLLCAGGDLSVERLKNAYQRGIFPWFNNHQPILWWSPDPRMVLKIADFRLHPSLRKTVRKFARAANCQVRVDFAFEQVIIGCATTARDGQPGTWILPEMVKAYLAFHRAGFAHSVETWVNDELVGGLYFVAIGQAVFGESMFHRVTDGSKIALVALACMCRHFNIDQIDCQQNTRHLASFGAAEISRDIFSQAVQQRVSVPGPDWHFTPACWNAVAATKSS